MWRTSSPPPAARKPVANFLEPLRQPKSLTVDGNVAQPASAKRFNRLWAIDEGPTSAPIHMLEIFERASAPDDMAPH